LYQSPHRSIEEMASHYLEALRAIQPRPPYLLGGWSLGGLIAFEMAQQLQRSGQEVALLAILDMPAPLSDKKTSFRAFAKFLMTEAGPHSWPYVRDYFQLMASAQDTEAMLDRPDRETRSCTLSHWRRMIGTVARELYSLTSPQATSRRILGTLIACMVAGSNYIPQPYPGQATLFRVQKQSAPDDEAQTMGWNKLVAKGVEVHHLPGHHFDILRKPQVQALAARLGTCIDHIILPEGSYEKLW
jgi:thioesterase domain-containing protein